MPELMSYILIAGLALCFVLLFAVYLALRSLRKSIEFRPIAKPECQQAEIDAETAVQAIENAAVKLFQAIHEAESLRLDLMELSASVSTAKNEIAESSIESGVAGEKTDASRPAKMTEEIRPRAPKLASKQVRECFDAVKQLLAEGLPVADIREKTGLSESEMDFVLGMLGAGHSAARSGKNAD